MKARFVILAVAAVLFSGCSSNNSGGTNSGGGGTSSFVGTWTCNDTLNDVITSSSGSQSTTTTEANIVVIVAISDGSLTLTSEAADGGGEGTGCTERLSTSGSTATLQSGQSCSFGPGVTGSFSSGTFIVSGTTATMNAQVTLSGATTGTISYAATCAKN